MGAREFWRSLDPWQQFLLVAVPGVGIGVTVGAIVGAKRKVRLPDHGYSPWWELDELIDYDEGEAEPEPPDIVYDEFDSPCVGPEEGEGPPLSLGEDAQFCTPPAELEPKIKTEVPFAEGGGRPLWPVATNAKRKLQVSYQDVRNLWHGRWGREFGATRTSKKTGARRTHAGVDLFADPGDVVVATEPGEVIAALPFYAGTGALYLKTDSGLILNYGEIEEGSWRKYDVHVGKRVEAGDRLARVGASDTGSHMLHFETYEPDVTLQEIRRGEMQWRKGDSAPGGLLDPTRYLVQAQRVHYEDAVERT